MEADMLYSIHIWKLSSYWSKLKRIGQWTLFQKLRRSIGDQGDLVIDVEFVSSCMFPDEWMIVYATPISSEVDEAQYRYLACINTLDASYHETSYQIVEPYPHGNLQTWTRYEGIVFWPTGDTVAMLRYADCGVFCADGWIRVDDDLPHYTFDMESWIGRVARARLIDYGVEILDISGGRAIVKVVLEYSDTETDVFHLSCCLKSGTMTLTMPSYSNPHQQTTLSNSNTIKTRQSLSCIVHPHLPIKLIL